MIDASGGLVSVLTTSLETPAHGWKVVSVVETSRVRLAGVSGAVSEGSGGVSSTSETEVTVDVRLAAGLPLVAGSRAPMGLGYRYVTVDGSFSYGLISWNGAELRTTDAPLKTTIADMVAAFLAASDTALAATLTAGPSSPSLIASDLLVAIKASIVDVAHGWHVRSVVETAIGDGIERTIGLSSVLLRVPVQGQQMRAQMTYMARLDAFGALVSARVLMNGAEWLTTDAALHSTMTTLANAFKSSQATALTAALED